MAKNNGQKRTEAGVTTTDPEFTPPTTRKRRHLTAQYKLRVLEEIDALPYGQTAAYLRREHFSTKMKEFLLLRLLTKT